MDVFDPSLAPEVGTPEPNGMDQKEFFSLLESIDLVKLLLAFMSTGVKNSVYDGEGVVEGFQEMVFGKLAKGFELMITDKP